MGRSRGCPDDLDIMASRRPRSLVLVKLERFRLAFQMVASELSRKSPGNIALVHAKALLDDAFTIEPDLPEDLRALLRKLDLRAPSAPVDAAPAAPAV